MQQLIANIWVAISVSGGLGYLSNWVYTWTALENPLCHFLNILLQVK